MKKQLIALALGLTATVGAMAVPARRAWVQVPGPDGALITVQKVGDENAHYFVDAEGKTFMREGSRFVAAPEARERARRSKARVADLGRFPYSTFPNKGKQKAIVILVQFKDYSFNLGDHAHDYFSNMLNQTGFSEYGATGCVHDYFLDSSLGQFDCQFDLFGPVTLKYNMAHYGGNDTAGNDKAPEEMVIEACQQLDATVDFSEYDRDNDGVIDNVFVIYAGRGEASDIYGDYADTVWPHSWDVSFKRLKFDGKYLATYGCSNEWEDIITVNRFGQYEITGERPDGIGTFVHEFSHVMGLPDLYDTEDSSNTFTPGAWSVLDYGPYNNNGRTPPSYGAFERNAMGWLTPEELTAGSHSLEDIKTSNKAFGISNPLMAEEFFLIETRARTGWDAYLPGEGMLIWHIDYDSYTWSQNTVNNKETHQCVDLIEADRQASKDNRTASDAFPGSKGVTSRTLDWWIDGEVALKFSDIAYSNGTATFTASADEGGSTVDPDDNTPSEGTLSVADVKAATLDASTATVVGYIVGYVPSGNMTKTAFSAAGCTVNSNIVLADSPEETNYANCIPVQLKSSSSARSDLNLRDNAAIIGRRVEVTGTLEKYCSVAGLKNVATYRFVADETDGIVAPEAPVADPDAPVYDLQGRRVLRPLPGHLYIQSGRLFLR